MALIQPTSGALNASSPIHIGYDIPSTATFNSVRMDVYIWSGDSGSRPADEEYAIVRQSGFISNIFHTDIAPLVDSALHCDMQPLNNAGIDYSQEGSVKWVQIDFTVDYTPSGGSSTVVQGTSNLWLVSRGFSLFSDGANKLNTELLLAPQRDMLVSEFTPQVIALNTIDVEFNSMSPEFIRARYTYSGHTYTLNIGYVNDTIETKVIYVPIGVPNVQNLFTNNTTGIVDLVRDSRSYKVEIINESGAVVYTINCYVQPIGRNTPVALAYINRFGAWDMIQFNGGVKESSSVKKSIAQGYIGQMTAGGFSYSQSEGSLKNYNASLSKSWTLNTGYVKESTIEAINDLLVSPCVVMVSNFSTETTGSGSTFEYAIAYSEAAVLVNTQSVNRLTHAVDKLVNYTIEVQSANGWNNMVI